MSIKGIDGSRLRTFTREDAGEVYANGVEYRKTSTIRAIAVTGPVCVMTSEGPTFINDDEPAFVATDGKSVWPISEEFMRANYDTV